MRLKQSLVSSFFGILTFSFIGIAQSSDYKLIVQASHMEVMAGDEVEYNFYIKNNSSVGIVVPTVKSSARNIDDILNHTFEVFNESGEQINQLFRCSVGGRSEGQRIMSGVLVNPGDSALIVTRMISLKTSGTYKAKYIFDYHPDNGSVPNPTPHLHKTIFLTSDFEIKVKDLNSNFSVVKNRISSEELEKAPVLTSISAALKDPNAAYRIRLTNPTMDEINMIHLFTNLQDVSLSGGSCDSIPINIFDLDLRKLSIRLMVKNDVVIPKTIVNSNELSYFDLSPSTGVDISGMIEGSFPELKQFILTEVHKPLTLSLDMVNFPSLYNFMVRCSDKIKSLPTDFSACENLTSFQIKAKSVQYGEELILPQITSIELEGDNTNQLPNLSKCTKLESLNLIRFELTVLPSHLLEIPNLKRLIIRNETEKNDVLSELKKKGIIIDKG